MDTTELSRAVVASPAAPASAELERFLQNAASKTRQELTVDADAATTFEAIRHTDVSRAPLVIALSRVRMLPDRILRRLRGLPPPPELKEVTIPQLIDSGYWIVLEDDPPRRLVLGLSMWDDEVERNGLTRERFDRPSPGAVRVCWSFAVEPLAPNHSRLITETRTEPTTERAWRKFRVYWTLISPFAGFTRRLVLDVIGAEAERRFDADSDQRLGAAVDPSEIQARRDAMCARQREWDDFDVPGDGYCVGEEAGTSATNRL